MKNKLLLLLCALPYFTNAQYHPDFLGGGHIKGITATSSADASDAITTVDGFNIQNDEQLADAARFLSQATLGHDQEVLHMTAAMGYEAWIDEQLALPTQDLTSLLFDVHDTYKHLLDNRDQEEIVSAFFRSAWWQHHLYSPDLLRQRLALAMSEIFVISDEYQLFLIYSQALSSFYDLLNQHAFGNFEELLLDISLSPSMGLYLSHYNNPREIPDRNIHPDENYAREIMQLFSIGLHELSDDGVPKRAFDGTLIPTYNNEDIRQMAKIFTGLGDGTENGEFFGIRGGVDILLHPMKMYNFWHDQGEKVLFGGDHIIPAGQDGMKDVEDVISILANHDNAPPFIGKAITQFLVTSNPRPAYVNDITQVWKDNGAGVRGDLAAVVKTILLHPDARDCDPLTDYEFGRLREPIQRYANFLKAFNTTAIDDYILTSDNRLRILTEQNVMGAPTVFNFFSPSYTPPGPLNDAYLVGPEFQILNASTSIGYLNEVNLWTQLDDFLSVYLFQRDVNNRGSKTAFMDLSDEIELCDSPSELVQHLNLLICGGNMTDDTKTTIMNAVTQLEGDKELQLNMALYLTFISPDYVIQK